MKTAEDFVKEKLNEKTGQGITLYEHYLANDTTISIGTAVSWMEEYASQPHPVKDTGNSGAKEENTEIDRSQCLKCLIPNCGVCAIYQAQSSAIIKLPQAESTKLQIVEILKKRVKNLIADDLVSPFFWEDFATEILNCQSMQAETPVKDEWISVKKGLTEIRNNLYAQLPTGNLTAWDLICIIKTHVDKLDKIIDSLHLPKAPHKD